MSATTRRETLFSNAVLRADCSAKPPWAVVYSRSRSKSAANERCKRKPRIVALFGGANIVGNVGRLNFRAWHGIAEAACLGELVLVVSLSPRAAPRRVEI